MSSSSISSVTFLLFSIFFVSLVDAKVNFNTTFRFVNAGDLSEALSEQGGRGRYVSLADGPYQVYFYQTTPNSYTLALRLMMVKPVTWVWEANRGKPVGDNAVFSLLPNGNMLLAEANGRIVWQTNTANKGVAGFDILPNGNMVLYDSKRNYLWQSFDYPTDTLLPDQYLKLRGPSKLVSRSSAVPHANGPYSLILEPTGLAMYYTSPLDSQRYQYFSSSKWFTIKNGPLQQVTLITSPKEDNASSYEVSLNYKAGKSDVGKFVYAVSKANPKYAYLRLEMDGNLNLIIWDWSSDKNLVFSLFSRDSRWASECEFPSKCSNYGLCRDNQCVACPSGKLNSPTGSLPAWSTNCTAPSLKSCAAKDLYYYKLVGVDHFSTQYRKGDGVLSQEACSAKCTSNCKCRAFFYHTDTKRCWTVNDMKTLISVGNDTHVAFVKAAK